jgi:hypothetical protein
MPHRLALLLEAGFRSRCQVAVHVAAYDVLALEETTPDQEAFLRAVAEGGAKRHADELGQVLVGRPEVHDLLQAGTPVEEWEDAVFLDAARAMRDRLWLSGPKRSTGGPTGTGGRT